MLSVGKLLQKANVNYCIGIKCSLRILAVYGARKTFLFYILLDISIKGKLYRWVLLDFDPTFLNYICFVKKRFICLNTWVVSLIFNSMCH